MRCRCGWMVAICCLLGIPPANAAGPPTCTVHFFDWYVTGSQAELEVRQKQWTYQVRWDELGIEPAQIGNTEHYYEVQFERIQAAGFDGIHYEWHKNNPKPQFLAALEKTGVPLAMFYDMEIRFSKRPSFITPTDEFAAEATGDVLSFYRAVPKRLWLRDRNGRLPIIVYGYRFDRSVTDPARWNAFYRKLLDGIEQGLGAKIVLHWTDACAPQQVYAYQHFHQIQSYTFNEAGRQTQAGARSVTFVVHYDDLGVSFARGGPRQQRWIRNDVRYLQESLWLAKHTDPDLVFNYGWNELYEGEHLLPDAHWGTWRYEVAAAMIRDIKAGVRADLPPTLVIADDFLPAMHEAEPETMSVLNREMNLLARLRSIVPQADVVLSGSGPNLAEYEVIFSINRRKDAREEAALADCGKTVVYAGPDFETETPMTHRFTNKPRRRIPPSKLGPANEFVVASRAVDLDLAAYPILKFRCRNSVGTIFHVRYEGITADGRRVQAWHESSPTDDRQTGGKWQEFEANVAQIARQAAGEPIARLSRIELILDDLDENGRFTLDVDELRTVNPAGKAGWEETFDTLNGWTSHASFEGVPGAKSRFGLKAEKEGDTTFARLSLEAQVREDTGGPADESTQGIEPLPGVKTLWQAEVRGHQVPLLLARDRSYWLNTYTPTDDGWIKLIPAALGLPVHQGVLFHSFSYTVTPEGLKPHRTEAAMVVQEAELPIERVRLVAPPELDEALPHTLPVSSRPMSIRVVRGERKEIPVSQSKEKPASIVLQPGEIVEVARKEQ